jgi:hypothetical protein
MWVRQPYVSKVKVKAYPLHAEQAEEEGRGTALPPFDPEANKWGGGLPGPHPSRFTPGAF